MNQPAIQASHAHAGAYAPEVISAQERASILAMQEADDRGRRVRITLDDMLEWVDAIETRERASAVRVSMMTGVVSDEVGRSLAVARKLVSFLEWCAEHREDVETLFRAKKHRKAQRG